MAIVDLKKKKLEKAFKLFFLINIGVVVMYFFWMAFNLKVDYFD